MTEQEQLLELRKDILTRQMEGQDQSAIIRATRNLERMTFADHDDFMSYVAETAGATNNEVAKATDEEVESLAASLGFGATEKKTSQKLANDPLEDIYKFLRI